MMTGAYVLVVLMFGMHADGIGTATFATRQACEIARADISAHAKNAVVRCYPKGEGIEVPEEK